MGPFPHPLKTLGENKKNSQKIIDELYAKRKNIYQLADKKIDCNNLDKESIAEKIIKFYETH